MAKKTSQRKPIVPPATPLSPKNKPDGKTMHRSATGGQVVKGKVKGHGYTVKKSNSAKGKRK